MNKIAPIPTKMIGNVSAADKSPRQVGEQFRRLIRSGYQLRADGQAKTDPANLMRIGYTPKYEIELFRMRFFLCNQRDAEGLKVMPAYVLPGTSLGREKPTIHARVFYKDSSLVWRSASHYINTPEMGWIGKGAVRLQHKRGASDWYSAEETTDLPFEMQAALDEVSHRGRRKQNDKRILSLVLRNAPSNRIWPYQDFEAPRERAMKVKANRINDNRSIAWFTDDDDPRSLQIKAGFEPDFSAVIDVSTSRSSMYGGKIEKYRIASTNRRIQYLFVAGPNQVWLVNPQALTIELSSYGLRTVDVIADDELSIPGYEFFDNAGTGELDDQIPPGFAGPMCPVDPDRADASPWNERLPVVQSFRRLILAKRVATNK
ncbi:MAG: hypothetical protein KJP16_04670 [Gammaproteobacteria bacterium]|nr:hypothetical protein [Gammaproteobacteria bacterium]NNL50089.1 hypothetical protein [Woeseiaceae bacterium]